MDVNLPDGTVINNVPDGMSKADLVAKLNSNGMNTSWYKPETANSSNTSTANNPVANDNPIPGAVGDESKYRLDQPSIPNTSDAVKPTGLMSLKDQFKKAGFGAPADPNTVQASDVVKSVGSSIASIAKGLVTIFNLPMAAETLNGTEITEPGGLDAASKAITGTKASDAADTAVKSIVGSMSPRAQEAMKKTWLTADTSKAIWADPGALVLSTAGMLPYIVGNTGAMKLAGSATEAAVNAGLTNIVMGAPTAASEARDTVLGYTPEQLQTNKIYQDLITNQGLSPEEAKHKMADSSAALTLLLATPMNALGGVGTSHALGHYLPEHIASGVLTKLGLGTLSGSEFGASSTFAKNVGVKEAANPEQDVLEGVPESAAAGAAMGFGLSAGTHAAHKLMPESGIATEALPQEHAQNPPLHQTLAEEWEAIRPSKIVNKTESSVTVEPAPAEFNNAELLASEPTSQRKTLEQELAEIQAQKNSINPKNETSAQTGASVNDQPTVDAAIDQANKVVNSPLTLDHIQPILDSINPRMSTGEVKVVPTMADLPENIKQRIDANGDPVEGVYTEGSGKVHLVADAFDNIDRVHQVLGHELVGHLAPTEIIDPKIYSNAVNSVIAMDKAGNSNIRQLGEIVDARQPGLDQHTRAKEIMAMAVENNSYKSSPVLRRVASDITYSVKKFLMSQGMDNGWVNKLSDHEVHSMLREGERRLYSGKTEKSISTPDVVNPQVAPMDESIKAMEPPKSEERIRPTSLFESSADYKVNTEDNGQLNVSVKRSKDGSVALFSDDGTIKEFNSEFAKDKTDADLLKYQYEPLGYKSHEEVNGNGSQEVSGPELKESFTAPAQIKDKQAKQVSIAMPGIKAGDIVNAKGKHFTNKDTAKAVAKMAGPGWRVQPTKEGFVVRYRPATESQIAASKASARARNSINTDTDSLHAAIAKLGGMNRDELVKVWGADPKEMANLRSGIKLVAPTKGAPIDRIADSLKELGYIGEDEHGKHDLNELMDHFFTELGGDKHYTKEGYERIAKEQEAILHEDYLAEKAIKDQEFAKNSENYQKDIDNQIGEFDDLTEEDNAKLQRELQEWEDWVTLNQHIIPDNRDEELDSSGRRLVGEDESIERDNTRENPSNEDLYGPYEGSLRNQEEVRRTGSGSQRTSEEFGLKGQTEEEARAQTEQQAKLSQEQAVKVKEAEQRAQADADRDSFNLTGSDRKADVEAAQGQQDLLASNQESSDPEIHKISKETYKQWKSISPSLGKVHGWDLVTDDTVGREKYVLMTSYDMVKFATEAEARSWAENNKANPKGYFESLKDTSPEAQVEKAKEALDKAGVTGTDRTSTIAAVRRGDLTAQEVAESHKPAAKIEDFGEVIGGAKKDLWQTYQKAMSEELPVDAKNITLSKHFPEPNYEKLIEAGVDVKSLAAVKAMRDAIPTKPQKAYRVTRWADQVRLLREFANGLISGKSDINHIVESMRKIPALEDIASRIDMYSELGYPAFKNAKGYEITGGWQTPGNPGHTQFALQGEKLRKQYFATRDEAVNAIKTLLGIKSELNGANKKQISFDIYRITATGERIIGKKVAPGKYIDLKTGFKDAVEARAYLRENQENLEKLLESKKENPIIRKGVNDPRIGEDYRKGDHITSDEYKAEFGFRGTQFGNYVEQARRQKELNNSYDALRDMAKIIDIPSKAISLNGELAIAFGARGNGGPDPAAAHYEPGQVVINLTKKNGFGSLAHEWFHALDNYFGKSSQVHDYLTYANRYKEINPEAVRPEVADAFREVMNTIKDSDFYKRSVVIDKYRAKDYWSTNEELGARAFEAYIKAKAEAKGESNDYLANIIGEEGHAAFNSMQKDLGGEEKPYPYPTKAEQEKINPAFDKLFEALQTKETDKGVALFSRKPATKEAYEKRIDELFNGKEADNRKGVRVLDRSDVLDILGYGGMPVNLAESKVILGIGRHKLKAADWKKVPEWIDNPVAVFDSDTKDGRLVFIPDDTIAGEPIKVILEPKSLTKGFDAHILINAYDAHSTMPTMRWFKEGLLRYIDNKKSQSLSDVSGLRLPNRHQLKTSSDKNLLRDRDLVNYRKENPETDVSDEGGTPLFSKRNKEEKTQTNPAGGKFKFNPLSAIKDGYSAYQGVTPEERASRGTIRDSISKVFTPTERIGAEQTAGIIRSNLATQAREREVAQNHLMEFAKKFDGMPIQECYEFVDKMERGIPIKGELGQASIALRKLLDQRRDEIIALGKGSLENFNENYFPHIWMDPAKASNLFTKRPLEGGKGFLKQRTYDYFSDAIKAGLEPVTTNPVELAMLKAREMDRYIYGQKIFGEMKDAGIAKFVSFGGRAPDGWEKINDKIARVMQFSEEAKGMILRGEYYAPEAAATIINNHLSSGLSGIPAYDLVRQAGNMMNQVQLGLSAFHLGFTTLDAIISKSALAIKQISRGDFKEGSLNLAQSVNPAQPFLNLYKGDKLLKAYMGDISDPDMAPIVESLLQAGGRVKMDDIYRNTEISAFRQALRKGNYGTASLKAVPRLLDLVSGPIFQYLVPRQKLGVFFDLAKDALANQPNMDLDTKRAVMGKLWDSVDNRMGEIVYDNVFWNHALKDALMVSTRSVGWNLGTFRELGGGVKDIFSIHKIGGLSDRTAYLFGLTFTSAILGAITQYIYTGKGPDELKDLFFPKTGKYRPDGTEDRLMLPTYMKDIAEYSRDIHGFVKYGDSPFNTITNKIHPLISFMSQMITNKDFFGGAIRSPADSAWKQVLDEANFALKAFSPFGIRNYLQQSSLNNEYPTIGGYLTSSQFIGITPAPSYITKNDAEQESAQVHKMHDSLMTKFKEEMRNGAEWSDIRPRARAAGITSDMDLASIHKSATQRPPKKLKSFSN
ncbi:LPD5 domain-containing protein [Polynucleobacter asymbioticus]|uniref:Large polyvalent protein-associated domain-containing protein n=1 Tax=Polynucleobacter asymbioticus TaxID=576611 RepID=A0AAC9IUU0_9BURK|nr:LPD5 domain-containing protein [Polynucleobacter asymbioticus]APB99009.1 hypothetical protein A4F89_06555 [Polynucleobacter asymbioticus]APC01311.1 hypothetical protein AOC25_06655 [Polynucleobacter asymbioticus]